MIKDWKRSLYIIIFGTHTRAGRLFDIVLLWLILISVLVVIVESSPSLNKLYAPYFFSIEGFFTVLFTIEYLLRIIVSPKPRQYILSIWGLIDLLSILPFYISLFIPNYQYFIIFRLFRLIRVFRILKLLRFVNESQQLYLALRASAYKIGVFITVVLSLVIILGTVMYVIEGPENGFTSIPQSIYWTIVTITTVGYGDITPQTFTGKMIASVIMLCGYAIIAVPTGIVTIEMSKQRDSNDVECPACSHKNPHYARFCNYCGEKVEL